MKAIWKFAVFIENVFIENRFSLEMPEDARILCVQSQDWWPQIWAVVNTESPQRKRHFRIFGTGHPLDEDLPLNSYIGTFQTDHGKFVWHLFEVEHDS